MLSRRISVNERSVTYVCSMWKAWYAAFRGVVVAWIAERHLKIHSIAAVAVVTAGCYLSISAIEWSILVLAMGLVLAAEYANSALERLADRVSTETHPLIRDAKDFAAAAVLIAAICASLVGVFVLGPKLWNVLALQ